MKYEPHILREQPQTVTITRKFNFYASPMANDWQDEYALVVIITNGILTEYYFINKDNDQCDMRPIDVVPILAALHAELNKPSPCS